MFQNFSLLHALTTLPGILIGFTFHEYAHAYMATKFGDPTPGNQGRLTANPIAHIDIWGFFLIVFAGFGWAKPVQTNPSYYRGDKRQKDLIVSIAGPITNLLIAIIFAILTLVVVKTGIINTLDKNSASIIFNILQSAIWINCVLFIFNLIPIPPLDGFHVLADIVPGNLYNLIDTMERYGYIILMIFIISPLSNAVIGKGAGFIYNAILGVLGLM